MSIDKISSMELLAQAREFGLLDSNITIKCINCLAIFPKEYQNCPQCDATCKINSK